MKKTFNFLTVNIEDGDRAMIHIPFLRTVLTETSMDDLADDIRSAQCWLRDVRRRQAENDTPELPMQ